MEAHEARRLADMSISLSLKKIFKSIGEEASKGKYFYQVEYVLNKEQIRYLEGIGYKVNTNGYTFITTILW